MLEVISGVGIVLCFVGMLISLCKFTLEGQYNPKDGAGYRT